MPMGKNEDGLTIVMNLVQINEKAALARPAFVGIREGLADSDDVDEFYEELFPKGKSPYGLNYLLRDENKILAVQALPDNQSTSYPQCVVHSNRYLISDWKKMSCPSMLIPHMVPQMALNWHLLSSKQGITNAASG